MKTENEIKKEKLDNKITSNIHFIKCAIEDNYEKIDKSYLLSIALTMTNNLKYNLEERNRLENE